MQIGTQLRQKVVRLYLAGLPNRAQNCRASFSELSNYPYVGHSPDQVIKTAGTEARTLIKVKIDFKGQNLTKDKANKLAKQHNDQMQLGMRVHNCQECMLLLYSCSSSLEISAMQGFPVDKENMFCGAGFALQDEGWCNQFEISAQCFCTSNLAWFYEGEEFNGQGATEYYFRKLLSRVQ